MNFYRNDLLPWRIQSFEFHFIYWSLLLNALFGVSRNKFIKPIYKFHNLNKFYITKISHNRYYYFCNLRDNKVISSNIESDSLTSQKLFPLKLTSLESLNPTNPLTNETSAPQKYIPPYYYMIKQKTCLCFYN